MAPAVSIYAEARLLFENLIVLITIIGVRPPKTANPRLYAKPMPV